MMKKGISILFCCLLVLTSCHNPENQKSKNSAATSADYERQTTNAQQGNSPPQASPTVLDSEASASKSSAVVSSSGQNVTYATEGELEVVGSETNYDIVLPSDILFDFDKYELRPEANNLLQKLKAHFATHQSNQVHVFGHTDSKGDDKYNAVLSQKRAVTVQKWLKNNTGVYAMALGMGEREPLMPNENVDGSDNPENRQRNRRVTVRVAVYPDVNKMMNKDAQ